MKKSELRELIKEELDKKSLKKEIDKLENALIIISDSAMTTQGNKYGKIFDIIKPALNSAKLDYETKFGNGNWKLNSKGIDK